MKRSSRPDLAPVFLGVLALLSAARPCSAQGPTVDVPGPPGLSAGESRLGAPLGSAGISSFDTSPGSQDRPLGGRAGPSVSRAPINALNPPTRTPTRAPAPRFRPPTLE